MMNRVEQINQLFGIKKPIIGMLHLKPLPGSAIYDGEGLDKIIDAAIRDSENLLMGGVNALQIENYGDCSYFVNKAAHETIAAMSIIGYEIRKKFSKIPMGVCLLADPEASIAVAHCIKAQFVRATFFTEAGVDVGGLVLRTPHEILRYRKFLDHSIKILADVHIKHSAPLGVRPIEESAYDAAYFLADAVIISGKHTGKETSLEEVRKVKEVLQEFPVFVGSGVNKRNVKELFRYADGAVVGTSFKLSSLPNEPVCYERVVEFMNLINEIRKKQ